MKKYTTASIFLSCVSFTILLQFMSCKRSTQSVNLCTNQDLINCQHWIESGRDGLWVDKPEKEMQFIRLSSFGGDLTNLFYMPFFFTISGDTMFVSDLATESIVCVDLGSSELLWRSGGEGEGPGRFNMIGHVVVSQKKVFVANNRNNRIEVFSRDGRYTGSIPVLSPFDLELLGDSILLVTSHAEEKLFTLINTDNNERESVHCNWETEVVPYINRDLETILIGDTLVLVASVFEGKVVVYSTQTWESVYEIEQELPLEIPDNTYGMFYERIRDVAVYEDSIILITLPPITYEYEPAISESDRENTIPLTIIDRYNIYGEYLESSILPSCTFQIEISGDTLFAADMQNGIVDLYRII